MSIVRENIMNREGYTPYCGNEHCRFHMPRTHYIGGQFQCGCGWRSSFEDEFIDAYEARWKAPAPQKKMVATSDPIAWAEVYDGKIVTVQLDRSKWHTSPLYLSAPADLLLGSEALVAWRVRHKNDGPHMWEYYLLPREKMLSDDLIYQDLTLRQLLDFLNDDRHANAQERAPEPHAPSYLMEAFRDAWKMANEAGVEDDWEDAFRFWAPPYAVAPSDNASPVLPKGVYTALTTKMTSPPPPRK